jgi:hypothetical protein
MTEKRMEDMIHEALEGGGGITQANGHDPKLIVTLVSLKGSLGRKAARNKGNGMIMNTTIRRKALRGGKNNLVFGKDSLEVRMDRGCLNGLNRMELSNDTGVAFLEEIFHTMGTNDLRRTSCETLELILLSFLLELHG